MRLCAIYNVWADWDWLELSVKNIGPLVDGIVIVASETSNHGEFCAIPDEWRDGVVIREPHHPVAIHSETDKRNIGLNLARNTGYTHFISLDVDEFYDPVEFSKIKERFHVEQYLQGIVCPSVVYFKSPTLSIGRDLTLVTHIHRLTPTIKHEFNRAYPHAFINNQIRIDPTRQFNINSGVAYTEEIITHHFSHVRKDYERKIRNSSARGNLERSTIRHDYVVAKEGEMCNYYNKRLTTVPNRFNLPVNGELLDENIQSLPPTNTAHKSHIR